MESKAELAKALNEFQKEIVTVGKTANNPFFKSKYADLGSIMKEAQPVLTKHGLSVVQLPSNIDGQPALTTVIFHTSGESIEATVPLVLSKQDPQGFGSAMTYFRRYGYASALQIVIDEDDDGNNASRPAKPASSNSYQNPEAPATEKQKQLIAKKLKEQGISLDEMDGHIIETYGVDTPLTIEGASFVISELIGELHG